MNAWERRLHEMRQQWVGLRAASRCAMTTAQREQVRSWSEQLAQIRERQLELKRAGYWIHGRPDLLAVLGRERREIYHSAMLRWLLDPGAPTGLGTEFLRRFLAEIDPAFASIPDERLESVSVQSEVARGFSRTDVVVFGDDFTVAIEVKVDAPEGSDQCLRIYRDFRDEPGVRFVFLTPGGRQPSTATEESQDAFMALSYKTVSGLLQSVLAELAGDREGAGAAAGDFAASSRAAGRATCESYSFTLKQEFHG